MNKRLGSFVAAAVAGLVMYAAAPLQAAPLTKIGAGGTNNGANAVPACVFCRPGNTFKGTDTFSNCTVGACPNAPPNGAIDSVISGLTTICNAQHKVCCSAPHGQHESGNVWGTEPNGDAAPQNIFFSTGQGAVIFNLVTSCTSAPTANQVCIIPYVDGVRECACEISTVTTSQATNNNFFGFFSCCGNDITRVLILQSVKGNGGFDFTDNIENVEFGPAAGGAPELDPGASAGALGLLGWTLLLLKGRGRKTPPQVD